MPRGIVGKRSELNEKTKLATIGANTNANTTATGEAANRAKIAVFRRGCGEAPLALALGGDTR